MISDGVEFGTGCEGFEFHPFWFGESNVGVRCALSDEVGPFALADVGDVLDEQATIVHRAIQP